MTEHESGKLVARQIAQDLEAETVLSALGAAGIDALLVKGAVTRRYLYGRDLRPSSDVDVLVAPRSFDRALAVLVESGYTPLAAPPGAISSGRHATELAGQRSIVDLHRAIVGFRASAEVVWDAFWASARWETLRTAQVPMPSPSVLAVHLTVHAAWSRGGDLARTREDLRRAARALSDDEWAEAVGLAKQLDGLAGLVSSLRESPEGREILRRQDVAVRLPFWSEVLIQLPPTVGHRLVLARQMPRVMDRARYLLAEAGLAVGQVPPEGRGSRLRYAMSRLPGSAASTARRVARAARRP